MPAPEKIAPKIAIEYDPDKCVGCGACQYFCSTYHEGAAIPRLSRITMQRDIPSMIFNNETCRQCVGASCMEVCEVEGAMYIDEKTGARCIDPDKCTGCEDCAEACPFNQNGAIIKYDAAKDVYVKCDLCSDREDGPICVHACGWGALSIKELA
jgi:Fe-S-cluster-containing hydrogenase component 2